MTFRARRVPRARLTTTPSRVRPDHAKQETVAFGDVAVEDSRNLTVNNSRKILRLAQCQVEYLLHVQETLVAHKERLRRCAEEAQRECIDAKSRLKHERVRAKELKRELRTARKALRTYEVLEQIRSGKPLEEILTGAIGSRGPDGEGSIAPGPGTASACPRRPWTRASCPPAPRSRARRNLRATAATEEEEEEEGRIPPT